MSHEPHRLVYRSSRRQKSSPSRIPPPPSPAVPPLRALVGGVNEVMCRAPFTERQTFSNTVSSPTFIGPSACQRGKGRACAPLREPQPLRPAMWEGYRRGGPFRRSHPHAAASRDGSSGLLSTFAKFWDLAPPVDWPRRGRRGAREDSTSPVGLDCSVAPTGLLSVLTFLIWGLNRCSNISMESSGETCPNRST